MDAFIVVSILSPYASEVRSGRDGMTTDDEDDDDDTESNADGGRFIEERAATERSSAGVGSPDEPSRSGLAISELSKGESTILLIVAIDESDACGMTDAASVVFVFALVGVGDALPLFAVCVFSVEEDGDTNCEVEFDPAEGTEMDNAPLVDEVACCAGDAPPDASFFPCPPSCAAWTADVVGFCGTRGAPGNGTI